MAKLRIPRSVPRKGTLEKNAVVVTGLGRFGQALALELMASGAEVLGIDMNEDIVQSLNGELTHVVQADATKEETLRQLAVPEFDRAVVAIGDSIESSILVTSLLLRFGTKQIWAKAVSEAHGTILEQLGVSHVIYPEKQMGQRVAHLVLGSMQDYLVVDDSFVLVKAIPRAELIGKSLAATSVRSKHGVTITAVKHDSQSWAHATPDTVLGPRDIILVSGPAKEVEEFTNHG